MLISSAVSAGASYETPVSLTQQARLDLEWLINNITSYNGVPILTGVPTMLIECDASSHGWGARCNSCDTGGLWSQAETQFHINYLETLAASFFRIEMLCKYT